MSLTLVGLRDKLTRGRRRDVLEFDHVASTALGYKEILNLCPLEEMILTLQPARGIRPHASDIREMPGSRHGDESLGIQNGLYNKSRISGCTEKPDA